MLIIYCQGEQGEGIPGPPGPPGPPGGITVCKLFFSKWYVKELFYNLVNTLLFDSRDSVLCMLFFVGEKKGDKVCQLKIIWATLWQENNLPFL